jgi:hypothetical protein
MKLEMKSEKVVGYILLAVGVVMILVSVYLMISVFTGRNAPPSLFNFSGISFPTPGGGEPVNVISGEDMNKLVALGVWYVLMFFVMWAGGKIASLGVSLIREIKVEAKASKEK